MKRFFFFGCNALDLVGHFDQEIFKIFAYTYNKKNGFHGLKKHKGSKFYQDIKKEAKQKMEN